MSISNIYNIGSTGIDANRLALEVTSENTANVNTPGYARQRVIFQTGPSAGATVGSFGAGVRVEHIQRAYDGMLQSQIETGSSTDGKNQTVLESLKAVEPSFNEIATNGLGKAIDDFFGSWQDLTLNPAGTSERQAVITRAQILVDNFHQVNSTLNQAITNADATLTGITADISDKAKSIADLNGQIKQTAMMGGNPNELLSQRDYLVRELSTKVGITVTPVITDPNDPSPITIKLSGGQDLVNGSNYATVYADNSVAGGLFRIYVTAAGNPPAANAPATDSNVTDSIGGPATNPNSLGEIGGTLKIRGSVANPGIMDGYLDKLDALAHNIAIQVNALHIAGRDLNSATGINFFGTGAVGADPQPVARTGYSSTIQLSSSLKTAGVLDPKKIAAAAAVVGVPGDNSNAVSIAAIAKNNAITFTTAASTQTSSISGYFNSFVSKVGIDVQGATNAASQSTAYLRQLNTLWESNSGVSLDEELTNLIKYQKAFQGSAKLINTATEMMDTVLGMVR